MADQHVVLTTGTLLNLIRELGAQQHPVFGTVTEWTGEDAVRAGNQGAHAELASMGLAGPGGLDPGMLATVEAIAMPNLEYYGWIGGGHGGHRLDFTLLAGRGQRASFVLARDIATESVVLVNVHPNELLESFLAQLPQLPAAQGTQVAVPKGDVTGRAPEPDGENVSVTEAGKPSRRERATTEFNRVLGLQRVGGGQLYVAARSRAGMRKRVDKPVSYIDTYEGRWLTEEVPGTGEPQLVATPATPRLLAERINRAQSTLRV